MKNYSSITDAYCAASGLKKVTYLNYLGEKVVAFFTAAKVKLMKRRGVSFED